MTNPWDFLGVSTRLGLGLLTDAQSTSTPLQIWSNFSKIMGSVGLEFSVMDGWGGWWQ